MAADDAKYEKRHAAMKLGVSGNGGTSSLSMDAIKLSSGSNRLDGSEDVLPALPPVPPMPNFAAGLAPRIAPEVTPARPAVEIETRPAAAREPAIAMDKPEPGKEAAPRIKGWVSLESDMVFRGWALNVGACDSKVEVSLYIDDELIASSTAEDFRPDLPCADKRHGFKFIVPTRFVDSIEHRWVVRAGADGVKLSGNATTFVLEPDAIPVISIHRIAPDMLSGVIECAALVKCGHPNIWIGADVLEISHDERVWNANGRKGSYQFDVPLNAEQFANILNRGMRVSIPGDRTGARALMLEPPVAWEFRRDFLVVSVGNPFDFSSDIFVPIAVGGNDAGAVVLDRLRFSATGVAEFRVPANLANNGFQLVLGGAVDDATVASARFQIATGVRSAVANWDFGKWNEGAPESWQIAEGVRAERRYASASRAGIPGAADDSVLLWTGDGQTSGQTLLSQSLGRAIKSRAHVGLVARAAQKCKLNVLLLAGDDTVIAARTIDLARDWQKPILEIPANEAGVQKLELRLVSDGVPWVELAGFDLVPEADFLFFDPRDSVPVQAFANPHLQGWTTAAYPTVCQTRTELAPGWFVAASKGTEVVAYPVPLQMLSPGANPANFALAVSTNVTSKFSRVEARIDPRAFVSGQTYSLKFNASAASLIDGSPLPRHRKWPVIDRIFVMMRDTTTGAGRVMFDCARRTNLPTVRTGVDIRFDVAEHIVDAISASQDELLLVFEFHSAFQVTMDSFSLNRVGPASPDIVPAIALEDGEITAQAASTKGCEHWTAPTACKWSGDKREIAPDAGEPMRWSWTHRDLGTIEVVICVYNAIDETLECLRSLARSTRVPHTVSIINDGSNPNGIARLEAFIGDKPWMRIHNNEANIGYTRSADFGIRSATSDWVVLLNSDTVVSAGWLEGLIEVAASDPSISLVGPVSNAASFQSVPELYDAAGQWAANEIPVGMSVSDMAQLVEQVSTKSFPRVPLLNGFCTLIKRSVFIEVGGLDATAFPMGYGEENDFCLRARDAGHMLAVADHVYVHHIKSASFGKVKRSELSKAGNQRLREKHPTTDFGRLGREFGDISALATLRRRVRDALRERQERARRSS